MTPIKIKVRKSLGHMWFVTVTVDDIIVFSTMRKTNCQAEKAAYNWIASIDERNIINV